MAEIVETSTCASNRELLPLENAKSQVWDYFGFPAQGGEFIEDKKKRNIVFCKLCSKQLSYQGSTTNMTVHLQYHHRSEFEKVKAKCTPPAQPAATAQRPIGQRSITEAFQYQQPLAQTSMRWKSLTNSVCYCIAKDMMPFSTVSNKGFKDMLHTFEPRYILPDRKTITQRYMPEMYQKEKAKITKAMEEGLLFFSITTDGWTSRANHSYITHTIHYINESWELCSHLLDTAELSSEHTGVNLASELEESLHNWNLPADKLVAVTTDNARNIVNALGILQWQHFGCFAHTLQLGVKKAMDVPQISKVLGRAKRLVSHFHHSPRSASILHQKQSDLHYPQLNLIQDVSTRWNSSFYMMERIIQQQQPLCAALLELRKTDLIPSDTEITSMEVFVEIMRPIVEITEVIGGEKRVTISAVRPLLHKLMNKHLALKPSDATLAKNIKSALLSDLRSRYADVATETLLNKACFLDPRFKTDLPF